MAGFTPPTRFWFPTEIASFVAAVFVREQPDVPEVQPEVTNMVAPASAAASALRWASLRPRYNETRSMARAAKPRITTIAAATMNRLIPRSLFFRGIFRFAIIGALLLA